MTLTDLMCVRHRIRKASGFQVPGFQTHSLGSWFGAGEKIGNRMVQGCSLAGAGACIRVCSGGCIISYSAPHSLSHISPFFVLIIIFT